MSVRGNNAAALPACRDLVRFAFAHGAGEGQKLLAPWGKNWRDLQLVAAKLKVEPFSLHTLRHSFATWHLAAGLSWDDTERASARAEERRRDACLGARRRGRARS